MECIQIREALIDENQDYYSLQKIAERRGLPGKSNYEMEQWMISKGMIAKGRADYSRLRDVPPAILAPYAAQDAALTLQIYFDQQAQIEADDLHRVIKLESDLIPILFRMRLTGVKVDLERAEAENEALLEEAYAIPLPKGVDPWSPLALAKFAKSKGFILPQTDKGNDSVKNEFLLKSKDDDLINIGKFRQIDKIRKDFVEGMIMNGSHKGRLHPNWFQTRGSGAMSGNDTNGTKSGRIACTNPNLTTIPTRHPIYGKRVRKLFVPEDGEMWLKTDFQAQEVRIAVHYAAVLGLDGAAEMRREYQNNPKLDYHAKVMDMVNAVLDKPISRNTAKGTNLALGYGMGKAKLALQLGMTEEQVERFLGVYHDKIPYVKQALKTASKRAMEYGYVKTILGRRRHFDMWENGEFGSPWSPAVSKEVAQKRYAKIRRAGTHKAWNSVIQGTAAEQTKTAIVQLAEEGIYPLMQLYDELDFSIQAKGQAKRAKEIMENAIPLTLPVIAEAWVAGDWGGIDREVIE